MKKQMLQPIIAIIALIVSIATATLCVFAWFTSNENLSGTFAGSIVNSSINSFEITAYQLDSPSTSGSDTTYTIGAKLGDPLPNGADLSGNTVYTMRPYGGLQTTAVLLKVELELNQATTLSIIAKGDDKFHEGTIPKNENGFYCPNLSEAVEIYSSVTATSTNCTLTSSTPYALVDGTKKITQEIFKGTLNELSKTLYFIVDYNQNLMQSIYQRTGEGSLTSALDFVNDIIFIADK